MISAFSAPSAVNQGGDGLNPRGAALLMVVVILVILEAAVAVAFVLGTAVRGTGRGGLGVATASNAAEAGLAVSLSRLPPEGFDTTRLPLPWHAAVLPGGGSFALTIAPLSPRVLRVTSTGSDAATGAEMRLAHYAALRPAVPELGAALVHVGDLAVTGSLDARGDDGTPPGWRACGGPDSVARQGTLALDTSVSLIEQLPLGPWLRHTLPPLAGGVSVLPVPIALGTHCLPDPVNWGDPGSPLAPCGSRMPVVYADGDLHVVGGMGQGLLVVRGDLVLGGGFRFHGLIVTAGRLEVGLLGATVVGAVVAAGRGGHLVRGPFRVHFSKCLLELGLPSTKRGRLLAPRQWAQLFDQP